MLDVMSLAPRGRSVAAAIAVFICPGAAAELRAEADALFPAKETLFGTDIEWEEILGEDGLVGGTLTDEPVNGRGGLRSSRECAARSGDGIRRGRVG
jgi:hypothetical protein